MAMYNMHAPSSTKHVRWADGYDAEASSSGSLSPLTGLPLATLLPAYVPPLTAVLFAVAHMFLCSADKELAPSPAAVAPASITSPDPFSPVLSASESSSASSSAESVEPQTNALALPGSALPQPPSNGASTITVDRMGGRSLPNVALPLPRECRSLLVLTPLGRSWQEIVLPLPTPSDARFITAEDIQRALLQPLYTTNPSLSLSRDAFEAVEDARAVRTAGAADGLMEQHRVMDAFPVSCGQRFVHLRLRSPWETGRWPQQVWALEVLPSTEAALAAPAPSLLSAPVPRPSL